jgi:SAM-dependent methyltransferase
MKERILENLVCPACFGNLSAEAWQGAASEIEEGLLRCDCEESFPIIGGIPRMLMGEVREQLHQDYPDFFSANVRRLPSSLLPAPEERLTVARKTQESFGYEWTQFSAIRPEWEENYWGYMARLSPDFFQGKTILDAGCGMGRHLYYTGQYGQEVFGVDFSRAVDVARHNTKHLPNVHVIQADLLRLPFKPRVFDFIYSLGVLHHIPESEEALSSLVSRIALGGELRIYVYWNIEESALWKRLLLRGVSAARQVTTRLPHPLLSCLCYPIAASAWLTFVLPYKILSHIPATRRFAGSMPLNQYARYPFGVLVNDQFDRFSAPLEKRYSAAEVQRWLESAGLSEVTVLPHWGWVGHGKCERKIGEVATQERGDLCQPSSAQGH